jgi:hypothetical protein
MTQGLNQEIRNVQNPALGAMLLWRFLVGYGQNKDLPKESPFPLLFLVLPILFHEETTKFVTSTQRATGLRAFATKFSESAKSKTDLLLVLTQRSVDMRELTKDSLSIAIASDIVSINSIKGTAISHYFKPIQKGFPLSVISMFRAAEKLGAWCSVLSLHEISIILKVGF